MINDDLFHDGELHIIQMFVVDAYHKVHMKASMNYF